MSYNTIHYATYLGAAYPIDYSDKSGGALIGVALDLPYLAIVAYLKAIRFIHDVWATSMSPNKLQYYHVQ